MSKKIPLTQGKFAIVDDEDYEALSQFKWCTFRRGSLWHACRNAPRNQHKKVYMHRVIAGAPNGMIVDHINGDGLDNRKANLRLANKAENAQNQRPKSKHYKGIYLHKASGLWHARVRAFGKVHSLGYFKTQEEAAKAYDAGAVKLHGNFARLNFSE